MWRGGAVREEPAGIQAAAQVAAPRVQHRPLQPQPQDRARLQVPAGGGRGEGGEGHDRQHDVLRAARAQPADGGQPGLPCQDILHD